LSVYNLVNVLDVLSMIVVHRKKDGNSTVMFN